MEFSINGLQYLYLFFQLKTCKALNGLLCADVPLRNYSLTHLFYLSVTECFNAYHKLVERVYRTAGGGRTVDGKPSTAISWRSDVQDNSRPDLTMKGGSSAGRRTWSIRAGRGGGSGRGGSSLLGNLEDDDLDCDLFDIQTSP